MLVRFKMMLGSQNSGHRLLQEVHSMVFRRSYEKKPHVTIICAKLCSGVRTLLGVKVS